MCRHFKNELSRRHGTSWSLTTFSMWYVWGEHVNGLGRLFAKVSLLSSTLPCDEGA